MGINIISLFFSFLLSFYTIDSNINDNNYLVYLTDKNISSSSIDLAKNNLSDKANTRREIHSIKYDYYDVAVSSDYISELEKLNCVAKRKSKWLNAVLIEKNDGFQISKIKNLPFVKSIKKLTRTEQQYTDPNKFKNSVVDATSYVISNSSKTASIYGHAFNQIEMVNGIGLHSKGLMGQGITIAVLDAGFVNVPNLSLFDDMYAEGRMLGGYDFVLDTTRVSNDHTHGTQVLSIMVGNNSGEYIGTAPLANYWLLRTEDVFAEYLAEEFFWALGAEFADSVGADIINSSLGYTTFDNPAEDHSYSDMDGNTTPITIAADIAASKGILVVNSAGNSGDNSWFYIGAPADGDSVLAIGGADSTGTYTSFSSKGPSFDGDIKPNVSAQAEQTWIANPWGEGVGRGNGTSFSGPIIAGMAACLWQNHPTKNNIEVMRAIEKSCHQYNNPDSLLGYGIPDFVLADAILSGLNVKDFNKDEIVNLYPNPSLNDFTLAFYSSIDQTVSAEVYDISGKVVDIQELNLQARSLNNIIFNNALANGVYVVSINSIQGSISRRIIIN